MVKDLKKCETSKISAHIRCARQYDLCSNIYPLSRSESRMGPGIKFDSNPINRRRRPIQCQIKWVGGSSREMFWIGSVYYFTASFLWSGLWPARIVWFPILQMMSKRIEANKVSSSLATCNFWRGNITYFTMSLGSQNPRW